MVEPGASEWTLSLRVPAWASGARLEVGDQVVLELPMAPRLVAPHPRIDAVRGCVAIERGPLVDCLEHADAPAGARLDDLAVDPAAPLCDVARADLLGGIVAVEAGGAHRPAGRDGWPYTPPVGAGTPEDRVTITAVPYALWGNRGDGPMRVWTPAAQR